MKNKKNILVLCTGNSARSQMAEGLLKKLAGNRYDVYSAGTDPSAVRPEAIRVLSEIGIDISKNRSKSVSEFSDRNIEFVLTVCDSASKDCPYFPAVTRIVHNAFPDPAGITGDRNVRDTAFRNVRDQITEYLPAFLELINKK